MALSSKLIIEIPILLIFFCFMLSDYITTNFIIYRTCYVTLGYNISDCKLLGTNNASSETKDLETKVQPVASVVMMTKTIIEISISVLFSLIVGPWSNKHGRKPVLLSTFIGFFLGYLVAIAVSLIQWLSPWWWVTSYLAISFGGGLCSMLTVTFCYIVDTVSEENRGIRMAILEGCFSLSSLLGTVASSYVFSAVGYTGIYSICAGISFSAIIYLYFLPESVPVIQQENTFKDLFNLSSIITSVKTCFKRRQNKDRLLLGLIMSFLIMYIFVIFSDSGIFFLYMREHFNWSLRMYTLFSAITNFIDILGATFLILFLHKYLKINDMVIIFVGFTALCISSTIFGLANTNWLIFLGAGIKRLSTAIGPLGRSAISVLLPPDDVGHVFAMTTSLETIVQLVSSPLYTLLYNTTIKTAPSTFNFLSASIYGLNIIITSAVIFIKKFYPNEEMRVIN